MKKLLLLLVLLSILVFPCAIKAETYTRAQLEDYVVSTTLSYYYNKSYTDYEGYWQEDSHSTFSTIYTITPEMLSRSKRMNTQCEAFAVTVYIHSLGYDFPEFYSEIASGRYTSFKGEDGTEYQASTSLENMRTAYNYFSKVYSVDYLNRLAATHPTNPIVVLTYQKGKLSTLSSVTTYTKSISEMTDTEKNALVAEAIDALKPGDIILNDGHAMMWVGSALESNGGIIHSSGSSFKYNDDGTINNGYDAFSVRYSNIDFLIESGIKKHYSKDNDVITIIRPLNAICNGDTCNLDISDNTKARSKLKNLKVEQFVYNDTDGNILSTDTSSVGKGDEISYRLYLKNESHSNYCTSNNYSKESDCTENGYVWMTTQNEQDYEGIKITATIPDNTSFVKCSNNCTVSGKNITWNNVNVPAGSNEAKYYYIVKVTKNDTTITNPGMKLTYDGETLSLAKIETKINNSVVGEYKNKFDRILNVGISESAIQSYDSGTDFVVDAYRRFYTDNTSFDSNTFRTLLDGDTIGKAVFQSHKFGDTQYYEIKNQTEINALNANQKIINRMVVHGIYGGKKYEQLYHADNMDYYSNRMKPIWSSYIQFNYGDIIVTLTENEGNFSIKNIFLYTGLDENVPTFTYYEDSQLVRHRIINNYHGTDEKWYANKFLLNELHSSDLYVVLRPSQYYRPTIQITITFDSGVPWTADTCKSPNIYDEQTHSCSKNVIYGTTYGSLPTPKKEGYKFKKWILYRVISGSEREEVPITSSMEVEYSGDFELVAQWEKITEEPANPTTSTGTVIPIEDTLKKKSFWIMLVGMVLISMGLVVVYRNATEEQLTK